MHDVEYKILSLFKDNPGHELSTSEVIGKIDPEYGKLSDELMFDQNSRDVKRKKAIFHRKYLYYFAKLQKEEILQVSRIGPKGIKYYSINLREGTEIQLEKKRSIRSIKIMKPVHLSLPIEGLEQSGVLFRFESSTWIERMNSVLLDCELFLNIDEFQKTVFIFSENINDCIGLFNFESIFKRNSLSQIKVFLKQLENHCIDYGKKASCIIDVSKINYENDVLQCIKDYLQENKNPQLNFVFDLSPKDLYDHSHLFRKLIEAFQDNPLYIKNKSIQQAPYFMGRAGPYTFPENEWKYYASMLAGKVFGLMNSQSTIVANLGKYFSKELNTKGLWELYKKISLSFLHGNNLQRKNASDYFEVLIKLNQANRLFFSSRNYLRLWDFWLVNDLVSKSELQTILLENKKRLDDFCIAEETIYKSCGMPTRFKIAISVLNEEYASEFFKGVDQQRITISGINDLYDPKIKEALSVEEGNFRIFDGGGETRITRKGNHEPDDIMREINFILTTYRIPFLRYGFVGKKEKNLRIDHFLK